MERTYFVPVKKKRKIIPGKEGNFLSFRFFTLLLFLLGYETARSLAFHGCSVVMACRSIELANEAAKKIQTERPESKVDVMQLCLEKLSSVKEFAEQFNNKYGYN